MGSTRTKIICPLLFALLAPHHVGAQPSCLDAEGEAAVVDNDISAAKAEAVARAKWAALEQAVGVEVKAQSVVQNMALVDESVSRQINGSVKSYKLLSQHSKDGALTVRINACIEPGQARDAVAGLALNNAVSVFLLAKEPHGEGEGYRQSNIVSETLIGKLAEKGFTVTDVAASRALSGGAAEDALKSGKLSGLASLMYRFLTNVVLIGKVDYAVSTKKGEDVGYGIAMPFTHVTARLTYRLITRSTAGEMIVVAAGTEQGKGVANTAADAASESLKELAENLAPVILAKVEKHLMGAAKKVAVRVSGISDLGDTFAVKEAIQQIAWVTAVEEKGLGEFTVTYRENPIYLANSIRQKGNFRIESFTPDSITVAFSR